MQPQKSSRSFPALLRNAIPPKNIRRFARACRFQQRRPKKVTPLAFVQSTLILAAEGSRSLRSHALLIGLWANKTLSKQALSKRFNAAAVRLLQLLLMDFLQKLFHQRPQLQPKALQPFARVLIQDSTVLNLDPSLAAHFPGPKNQLHRPSAAAKIQAIFDLKAERFIHFDLTPFTHNDQAAAHDIDHLLRPKDLLIRDLGCFAVRALGNLQAQGVFFLSRLRADVAIFSEHDSKPINLLKLLRRQRRLDLTVLLGAEEKLPVRLVALPVPAAVAAERRRKARANRDRRCNPSPRHLALLDWVIFVTSVDAKLLPTQTIAQLYSLRWRIESIFKAWKSHFHFAMLPKGSLARVQTMLWTKLLLLAIFQDRLWRPWNRAHSCPSTSHAGPLSLLKLAQSFALYLPALLLAHLPHFSFHVLTRQMLYHDRYDSRKRLNFFTKFAALG